MIPQPNTEIGPFVVGEIPLALEYQFLDEGGAPLDISGYAAKFVWRERDGLPTTEDAVLSTDGTDGKVTYTWDGDEFPSPGHYIAELWVGDGAQRFASVIVYWNTRSPVGSVPSI